MIINHLFFQNPRATGSRILLFLTCVASGLLLSCGEKKTPQASSAFAETEQVLQDDANTDESASAGEGSAAVTTEQVTRTLTRLHADVRAVLSPSMLQTFLSTWPARLEQAETGVRLYAESYPLEAEALILKLDTIRSEYNNCVRTYQLPASNILATIGDLQSRLDANPTRPQFCRIRDVRIGFFRNLPTIHLIVREADEQTQVQSRALRLQKRYLQLCQQYDLQP